MLGTFREKTSKDFKVLIEVSGVAQDISNDTVKLFLKKNVNGSNQLVKTANVATEGAQGYAIFELSPADMDLDVGKYTAFIRWETGTKKYTPHIEAIEILEGVGDETEPS